MSQLDAINPFARIGKALKDSGGAEATKPPPAATRGDIYLPPDPARAAPVVDASGKRIGSQPTTINPASPPLKSRKTGRSTGGKR